MYGNWFLNQNVIRPGPFRTDEPWFLIPAFPLKLQKPPPEQHTRQVEARTFIGKLCGIETPSSLNQGPSATGPRKLRMGGAYRTN